jgi:hypothetical protein
LTGTFERVSEGSTHKRLQRLAIELQKVGANALSALISQRRERFKKCNQLVPARDLWAFGILILLARRSWHFKSP